ncbi:MAG: HesA/MoeB/ThiF family protein [Bacillota bacterium]
MDLKAFLAQHCQGDLLPWSAQVEAAERFQLTLAQVEEAALEAGFLPARYQRNRQTISLADQLTLLRSTVAVIGCGGLGGYILEELARLGVGRIYAIDPDGFEEHNLNRQLLSTPADLGRPKVMVAAERLARINPAVTVVPQQKAFSQANGRELLAGAQVVVDALDNIDTRLELAAVCRELQLPLVHGAIGGWFGQVTTQFPGEETVERIYRRRAESKGVEKKLGNPAFTPAVVASLEVAEVAKILLRTGESLRQRLLTINLLTMEMEIIEI